MVLVNICNKDNNTNNDNNGKPLSQHRLAERAPLMTLALAGGVMDKSQWDWESIGSA